MDIPSATFSFCFVFSQITVPFGLLLFVKELGSSGVVAFWIVSVVWHLPDCGAAMTGLGSGKYPFLFAPFGLLHRAGWHCAPSFWVLLGLLEDLAFGLSRRVHCPLFLPVNLLCGCFSLCASLQACVNHMTFMWDYPVSKDPGLLLPLVTKGIHPILLLCADCCKVFHPSTRKHIPHTPSQHPAFRRMINDCELPVPCPAFSM